MPSEADGKGARSRALRPKSAAARLAPGHLEQPLDRGAGDARLARLGHPLPRPRLRGEDLAARPVGDPQRLPEALQVECHTGAGEVKAALSEQARVDGLDDVA